MTSTTIRTSSGDWRDPGYQAFIVMRLAFTIAPIAFGLDKFLQPPLRLGRR